MPPVEIRGLSKRFGDVEAVRGLSFAVVVRPPRPGSLGPNGAGKSTTLRALLGLIRPSGGLAPFGGRRDHELDHPSSKVGAVLEENVVPSGGTGRNHLPRAVAVAGAHSRERVDEVLDSGRARRCG